VTGLPAILLVHVTVAFGVTAYAAPLERRTGCAPTSVGLIEKIMVPVMEAVVVRVIVDMRLAANGAPAVLITSKHTWKRYVPAGKLFTSIPPEKATMLPFAAST
jgi:hypothetical protein